MCQLNLCIIVITNEQHAAFEFGVRGKTHGTEPERRQFSISDIRLTILIKESQIGKRKPTILTFLVGMHCPERIVSSEFSKLKVRAANFSTFSLLHTVMYITLSGGWLCNGCMGGIEHSYAAGVQLEDQPFFGINPDTVAGEFGAVENKRHPVRQLDA